MQPSQYRLAIIKVLKDAQLPNNKAKSFEELAERIVHKMQVLDEAQELLLPEVFAKTEEVTSSLIVQPSNTATSPFSFAEQIKSQIDISQRIVPARPISLSDDEIIEKKTAVIQIYKNLLPQSITVQPPNFDAPIHLKLRLVSNTPGANPFVSVQYAVDNDPVGVTLKLNMYSPDVPPMQVVKEITEMANASYSPKQRSVQHRMPPPNNLDEIDFSAPGATTDRDTGSQTMGVANPYRN